MAFDPHNQFATAIYTNGGQRIRYSRNLRAMLEYSRVSPVFRVKATPCPKNPYNGRLFIEYENGCRSEAFFSSYTVLLEFLTRRRSWRNAPFWSVYPPDTKHIDQRAIRACEALNDKGLFQS